MGRQDESSGDALVFASGSAATAAMCSWVTLQAKEGGAGGVDGFSGGGGHILAVNDVVSCSLSHGMIGILTPHSMVVRLDTSRELPDRQG